MASFSYQYGACSCPRDKCSYECVTYRRFSSKPITKGDKLRASTDEELAEWIETIASCSLCPFKDKICKGGRVESRASCKRHWLDWMMQEAEE